MAEQINYGYKPNNEIDKFDREVDQVGLLRAVINKFFKKEK